MFANFQQPCIAPVAELYRDWQRHKKIKMDWLLQLAKNLGQQEIYFYRAQPGSEFYHKLNQMTVSHGLIPSHAIHCSDFFHYFKSKEDLKRGVNFTLLINRALTVEEQKDLNELRDFKKQLQFVMIARKDWALRNGYRSFPYEFRDHLYVDFPVSLYPDDPFYRGQEVTEMVALLKRDFAGIPIRSFCPQLAQQSFLPRYNISHFSVPRKLTDSDVQVSLVCDEPKFIKQIGRLPGLMPHLDQLELVVTRVAGQRTQVVPKLKSLTTTRYWVHLRHAGGKVPFSLVKNFSVSQCSGKYVIFVNSDNISQLDLIVNLLIENEEHHPTLLSHMGHTVFDRQAFAQIGGFDPSLNSDNFQRWDILYRYLLFTGQEQRLAEHIKKNQFIPIDFAEGSIESLNLYHKHLEIIQDWQAPHLKRGEQNYSLSLTQVSTGFQSLLRGGTWRRRLKAAAHLPGALSKALSPVGSIKHLSRNLLWMLRPSSYHGYWVVRRQFQAWGWSLHPVIYRIWGRVKNFIWRLNPKIYPFYWKCRAVVVSNLWRLSLRQIGWYIFKVLFPVRKIYYFTRYQYQKRVLGLHQKTKKHLEASS